MSALAVHNPEPTLRPVEFRLKGELVPGARRVGLAASFNQWRTDEHVMRKGPDGGWTVVVMLPPGVYAYLFFADGVWWNDPADDGRVPSGWGNEYSLRVVR